MSGISYFLLKWQASSFLPCSSLGSKIQKKCQWTTIYSMIVCYPQGYNGIEWFLFHSFFMPFTSFQWPFLIFSRFFPFSFSPLSFLCLLPFPLLFTETYMDFQLLISIWAKTAMKRKLCSDRNIFFCFTLGAICSFGTFWIQLKRQCVSLHLVSNRLPDSMLFQGFESKLKGFPS